MKWLLNIKGPIQYQQIKREHYTPKYMWNGYQNLFWSLFMLMQVNTNMKINACCKQESLIYGNLWQKIRDGKYEQE